MDYTRVDTKKLSAAITKAIELVKKADEAVGDVLELLTPTERAALPKPHEGFAAAARLVADSTDLDGLKDVAGYDGEAVHEDLANVEAVDKLSPALAKLTQRVADSRLLWLAEAYSMNAELYRLAKARAKSDAVVAKAIEPLAAHFAVVRLKKNEPK